MNALSQLLEFISEHPLTRQQKLRTWARVLHWQISSRLSNERIVPWVGGTKLAARRSMTGATGNIYAGLHEFPDMALTLHFLRPGDLFVDIGANVGSYTILAAAVRGAHTRSFEPDPDAIRALHRNVEINGIGSLVEISELAIGDQDGQALFTVGGDTVNHIVGDGSATKTRTVQVCRLDAALGPVMPSMLKIDTEGHEEQVFRGGIETLAKPSLKLIVAERPSPLAAELIARAGFERAYYEPFDRRLTREPNGLLSENWILVRDWPFVEERVATAVPVEVHGRRI